MSPRLHPNGFRISDQPVATSFAHPYSFQPIQDYSFKDDNAISSSLNLGGVEQTWVKYWDEASMLSVLEFDFAEPIHQEPETKEKEKKEKRRAKGTFIYSAPNVNS